MDEFKIRLPVVLNGTYSLLFTFFHLILQLKKFWILLQTSKLNLDTLYALQIHIRTEVMSILHFEFRFEGT